MKRILTLFLLIFSITIVLINYQNELLLIVFPEKIWVHRVNSIKKLQEVHKKFRGVELDVVFNENIFDINHPPAQSIGLSLSEYLSSINLTSNNRFWIDFKNLSENNMESACLKLDSLCSKFKLNKEQFIVESTSHPQYLSLFNTKGFKTSHYLYGVVNGSDIDKAKDIRTFHKTHYISSDKMNIKLIEENFPSDKIITWSYNYSARKTLNPFLLFKNLKLMFQKYKVLSDKSVMIVLFKYKAKTGNR